MVIRWCLLEAKTHCTVIQSAPDSDPPPTPAPQTDCAVWAEAGGVVLARRIKGASILACITVFITR